MNILVRCKTCGRGYKVKTSAFDVPCSCMQCNTRMWKYNLHGPNPVTLTENAELIHYTYKERILNYWRKLRKE